MTRAFERTLAKASAAYVLGGGRGLAAYRLNRLVAQVDRSPEGGDHEDGRHAKHESAVGNADAPEDTPHDSHSGAQPMNHIKSSVGASRSATGLSQAEPEEVSALRASIPSAVERIAAGLFLVEHPNAEWHGGRARSIWFARAWAALEAIREPTDAMLQGACDSHAPGAPMNPPGATYKRGRYSFPLSEDECPRIQSRRRAWQQMIDAALAWPTSDDVASAIEARRAATENTGAVHESATAATSGGDAQRRSGNQ